MRVSTQFEQRVPWVEIEVRKRVKQRKIGRKVERVGQGMWKAVKQIML